MHRLFVAKSKVLNFQCHLTEKCTPHHYIIHVHKIVIAKTSLTKAGV